jgi:hypothetical protein
MFDSETLRPVIIAMALYLVFAKLVPKIAKKPTNIKIVDDFVMYMIAQNGFFTSGVILIGLIMYLSGYINTNYFLQSDATA